MPAPNEHYRAPATEPARKLRHGPFAPSPPALALVLGLAALTLVTYFSAEIDSEVECWRDHAGEAPTCVRRSRSLAAPEVWRSSPAVLERLGPSGSAPPVSPWSDALHFDGITLLLPNNPPGPLTHFLDAPDTLHVQMQEGASDIGGEVFPALFFVLLAFFLPRALWGLVPVQLGLDQAAGVLSIRRVGAREVTVPIEEIARLRVETAGEGFLDRLMGARVVLERVDGSLLPLTPYARPPMRTQAETARALTAALGLPEVLVSTSHPPTSPPRGGVGLAVQVLSAALALVSVIAWLRHLP